MGEVWRLQWALEEVCEVQLTTCKWHLKFAGCTSQAYLEEAGSHEELVQWLLQLFPATGQATFTSGCSAAGNW